MMIYAQSDILTPGTGLVIWPTESARGCISMICVQRVIISGTSLGSRSNAQESGCNARRRFCGTVPLPF